VILPPLSGPDALANRQTLRAEPEPLPRQETDAEGIPLIRDQLQSRNGRWA